MSSGGGGHAAPAPAPSPALAPARPPSRPPAAQEEGQEEEGACAPLEEEWEDDFESLSLRTNPPDMGEVRYTVDWSQLSKSTRLRRTHAELIAGDKYGMEAEDPCDACRKSSTSAAATTGRSRQVITTCRVYRREAIPRGRKVGFQCAACRLSGKQCTRSSDARAESRKEKEKKKGTRCGRKANTEEQAAAALKRRNALRRERRAKKKEARK
ncbi:uncharacterized protein N0V89_006022 [Didymosphaeria variabile]|uniref:Uncharacterized protein n=1 Tax=Didymosphaeria variabile TaxID=1932322 RepID=A0A9W8XP06_9PLEO|nr:uncharacterized protein N0V89_006022 [Didymosphaeria variabile]KAJ4354288.1 hypothetical protein N0V89_006022 [Didymosphaeria variabile]